MIKKDWDKAAHQKSLTLCISNDDTHSLANSIKWQSFQEFEAMHLLPVAHLMHVIHEAMVNGAISED